MEEHAVRDKLSSALFGIHGIRWRKRGLPLSEHIHQRSKKKNLLKIALGEKRGVERFNKDAISQVKNTTRQAVMVFLINDIFGKNDNSFYTPDYLLEHDVVLVTVNYRLGYFGKWSSRPASIRRQRSDLND